MAFPIKVRFVLFNEPVSTDPFICIPFFILSISFDRIRSQFGHRMGFTHFPYNIHAYPKCHVQYSTIFLLYRLDIFFFQPVKKTIFYSAHTENINRLAMCLCGTFFLHLFAAQLSSKYDNQKTVFVSKRKTDSF